MVWRAPVAVGSGAAGAVAVQDLAAMFVEFADTLVDDFDLIDFLHQVSERTAGLLGGGVVAIHLADPVGVLRFVAAWQESAPLIQMFESGALEGPGPQVLAAGRALAVL